MNWAEIADLKQEPRSWKRCTDCGNRNHPDEFRESRKCNACRKIAYICRNLCITRKEYLRLIASGHCAICGDSAKLHIDHCHASGKLRGALCGPCNQALGLLRDDPQRIENAANYLRRWKAKHSKTEQTERDIQREANMKKIRD